MHKIKFAQSVIVIMAFLIAVYGKRILSQFINITFDSPYYRVVYSYSWWILPIILTLGILYGFKNIVKELCLDKNVFSAFTFALIAVSPMLISSAIIGEIESELNMFTLAKSTLLAGFMEEVLFRGFLFGILFRKLGWGFIPAVLAGAIIFGIGHLYQGSTIYEMTGIFFITFIGSAWFAWLFIERDQNLWIPIFLHILMNLSWALFSVSDNALGGVYANIFRVITIAITVVLTIKYCLKKGRFQINSNSLFINSSD